MAHAESIRCRSSPCDAISWSSAVGGARSAPGHATGTEAVAHWDERIARGGRTTARNETGDYAGQHARYTNSTDYKPDDPEFYTALEEWAGRPTLAPPERPLLPTTLALPDQPLLPSFEGEPMSEKLARLPSVGFWIVITLLVAVLVICLLGSIIGLMVQA
jgi:hypothetical protein